MISRACSVLSVDRRQLPEQQKYVVACITNSGACNLKAYSDIHVQKKILLRQGISKPILTTDSDN